MSIKSCSCPLYSACGTFIRTAWNLASIVLLASVLINLFRMALIDQFRSLTTRVICTSSRYFFFLFLFTSLFQCYDLISLIRPFHVGPFTPLSIMTNVQSIAERMVATIEFWANSNELRYANEILSHVLRKMCECSVDEEAAAAGTIFRCYSDLEICFQ